MVWEKRLTRSYVGWERDLLTVRLLTVSMVWRYRGVTARKGPPVYRRNLSPGRDAPTEQENLHNRSWDTKNGIAASDEVMRGRMSP